MKHRFDEPDFTSAEGIHHTIIETLLFIISMTIGGNIMIAYILNSGTLPELFAWAVGTMILGMLIFLILGDIYGRLYREDNRDAAIMRVQRIIISLMFTFILMPTEAFLRSYTFTDTPIKVQNISVKKARGYIKRIIINNQGYIVNETTEPMVEKMISIVKSKKGKFNIFTSSYPGLTCVSASCLYIEDLTNVGSNTNGIEQIFTAEVE